MADLIADNILELEFDYVRETANQATGDRHKILSFYVGLATSAGTASIAIFSLVGDGNLTFAKLSFALLTFLIAVVGWIFLAMMIRLRQAWYESLLAMNKIKDFYIKSVKVQIKQAFLWDTVTLPRPQRLWNIHFYSTLLINFISSLALTVSISSLFYDSLTPVGVTALSVTIWLMSLVLLTFIYWISLVRNL